MPRIYTSDNDPLDFCRRDFPDEQRARALFANRGDGPDGRGNCFDYDTEHPSYSADDYTCETCGASLTERD
jgi:hypothetical protein